MVIAILLILPDAQAHPAFRSTATSGARSIQSTVERPIAPRGGILLLPLLHTGERALPDELPLTLTESGETIRGRIAWIAPAQLASRHWTHDPRNLAVYPVRTSDLPPSDLPATPILVARLPDNGDGAIQFGRQTLEPIWSDVPATADAEAGERRGSTLERKLAADRPDPDSPFEYWRWVLLAERLDALPPPPPGNDPAVRMVAEHIAQLWLIGLERLERHHPDLALRVRDLLTRSCDDRGRRFAAWVSDVSATNELLDDLINMRRPRATLVEHVSDWVERHDRLIIWSESATPDNTTLAMANPAQEEVVVRLSWVDVDEFPAAAELEPGKLNRLTLDRPALELPRGHSEHPLPEADRLPSTERLSIRTRNETYQILFEQRFTSVQPPGVAMPAFHPPLTLFAAQTGVSPDIPMERETFAHLRRVRGRWELFIECRRPLPPEQGADTQDIASDMRGVPDNWRELHALRNIEGVVVIIGDDPPDAVLLIREDDWYRLIEGEHDGTLQIHRRSRADRWFVRIVLPDAWLQRFPGEVTRIGCLRLHHDLDEVHSAPYPMATWRTAPGRANFDLSRWSDLPFPADVRGP